MSRSGTGAGSTSRVEVALGEMCGMQSVASEPGISEPQAVSIAATLLRALLGGNDILGMTGNSMR